LSHKHPSRRRNERIAQVFFARKFIDRWGGGTGRILRLCAEQNLPPPSFSEETDGFVVRFFFKEPIGSAIPKLLPISPAPLNKREIEILQILVKGEHLSLREIVERLRSPPAPRTVGDNLAHLKKINLVDSEGTGRGARWFIVTNSK
jgi:ATP-dependent DNA helicase RecG